LFNQKFDFPPVFYIFDQNFDFPPKILISREIFFIFIHKILIFVQQILKFSENLHLSPKIAGLCWNSKFSKPEFRLSFFGQNSDFQPVFYIFDQNFEFPPKFRFSAKNFNFSPKFQFFREKKCSTSMQKRGCFQFLKSLVLQGYLSFKIARRPLAR